MHARTMSEPAETGLQRVNLGHPSRVCHALLLTLELWVLHPDAEALAAQQLLRATAASTQCAAICSSHKLCMTRMPRLTMVYSPAVSWQSGCILTSIWSSMQAAAPAQPSGTTDSAAAAKAGGRGGGGGRGHGGGHSRGRGKAAAVARRQPQRHPAQGCLAAAKATGQWQMVRLEMPPATAACAPARSSVEMYTDR